MPWRGSVYLMMHSQLGVRPATGSIAIIISPAALPVAALIKASSSAAVLGLVTDKHLGSLVAVFARKGAKLALAVAGDGGKPLHQMRIPGAVRTADWREVIRR